MSIGLVPLPGFEPRMESVRKVRAFAWKGKSPVQAKLVEWQQTQKQDFNRVMGSLAYVASTKRPYMSTNNVKKDEDAEHGARKGSAKDCPIYEARAHTGSARVFFFHTPGPVEVAVCVHWMWKTKKSKTEQAREFKIARGIRDRIFDDVQSLIAKLHLGG